MWLAALLFVVCNMAMAAEQPGIDAVLVIDSSGSMKTSDPKMLRVSAAKLFISLLGENDRVAVESFSGDGFPILGLTSVRTDQDRARLLAAVDKISSHGAYTNLHAAVVRAREMLQPDSGNSRPRLMLMLTDGKMDTGDKQKDAQLTQKLQGELTTQLNGENIAVHTIAFTRESDVELLRAVSEKTRARFHLAESDKELHGVYLRLFEGTKKPDMLPIEGGAFRVDLAISELTVVAVKTGDKMQVTLKDPAGTKHDASQNRPGIRWLTTEHYDIVTITNPMIGSWKLLSSEGQSRAYIVTDMKLDTDVPAESAVNAMLDVRSWLTREQKTLTKKEILASTKFSAELVPADGEKTVLSLKDDGRSHDQAAGDGVYGGRLKPARPGNYELRLTAKNPTFERRITRAVTVPAPPPAPEPAPVAEKENAIAPEEEKKPEADTSKPVGEPEKNSTEKTGNSGETESGTSLWMVLGMFVLMNVLLGAAALGFYLWYRKRNPDSKAARFLDPGADGDEGSAPEDGKA